MSIMKIQAIPYDEIINIFENQPGYTLKFQLKIPELIKK